VWSEELQQTTYWSPSRNLLTKRYIDVRAWDKTLVGQKCRIYWTAEEKWFDGVITRYNARKRRFKVVHPVGRYRPVACNVATLTACVHGPGWRQGLD